MGTNRELKKRGRAALAGSRSDMLAVSVITILAGGVNLFCFIADQVIMIICSMLIRSDYVPALSGALRWVYLIVFIHFVISVVAGSFIEMGYNRIILMKLKGKPVDKGILLYFRPVWLNTIFLRLYMGAKAALWSFLFIVPGIAALLNYSMAPYLIAQDPHLSPPVAVRLSKKLMKGYKLKLLKLIFSYIIEMVMCFVAAGIPFVAVIPEIKMSVGAFYMERVRMHDNEIIKNGKSN